MNNKAIETLSVNAVKNSIVTSEYLDEFIADNDKEPSWDGFIYIYNNKNKTKNDIIGRVPVQVKGKFSREFSKDTIKYSVSVTDLKNYLNDGIFFFVVYIQKQSFNTHIYYAALSPMEVKKYLKKAGDKKSQTIKLNTFPHCTQEKQNLFLDFHAQCQRQKSYVNVSLLSLEELTESGALESISIPFSFFGENTNELISTFLKRDQLYTYAKIRNSTIEQPLDLSILMDSVELCQEVTASISVNNIPYYNNCFFVHKKEGQFLKIGNSFNIPIEDKRPQGPCCYKASEYLRSRIKDLKFFLAAIEYGQIEIDKKVLSIDTLNIDFEKFKEYFIYLKKIDDLLNLLNIEEDIQLSTLTDEDQANLSLLITCLIDKKTISGLHLEQSFFNYINFAKYKILVVIEKQEDENYQIQDFFTENQNWTIKYEKNGRNIEERISQYTILNSIHFISAINIKFDLILPDIQKVGANPANIVRANDLMLQLLIAYDQKTNRSDKIFKLVKDLFSWIKSTDRKNCLSKEIKLINELQIIKRERDLSPSEIHVLYRLTRKKTISTDILTGLYLLLNEQGNAEKYFNKLAKQEQEEFIKYPIYYFWKD